MDKKYSSIDEILEDYPTLANAIYCINKDKSTKRYILRHFGKQNIKKKVGRKKGKKEGEK